MNFDESLALITSNAFVSKSVRNHFVRAINVAKVNDDWAGHLPLQAGQVERGTAPTRSQSPARRRLRRSYKARRNSKFRITRSLPAPCLRDHTPVFWRRGPEAR